MTKSKELWEEEVVLACLAEAGDDVELGVEAAGLILSNYSPPKESEPINLSHDIHNRRAQGILNRSLEAVKSLNTEARSELEVALKSTSGEAIIKWLDKYRLQLARLLTTTQLASLLEGAREITTKIPTLATFPGAVPPPPSLEFNRAIELVESISSLKDEARAKAIYELPPEYQVYIQQALAAKEAGGPIVPPKFTPPSPPSGSLEEIHFPVIDEAVKQLAEKNVITRERYDLLESSAKAKAFTVASVEAEETLTKIRDVLAENIQKGVDYEAFKQEVLDAVDEGTFLSDAHQETVFRTNVQAQFSDGQMTILRHPLIRSGFPYAVYDSIHDNRRRKEHGELEHLGIDGTNVYRINDPVFQTFRPPWDYNDRCSWTPITVRHAAELGIAEAQQWLNTGIEPSPPAFVPMPSFEPPADFRRPISMSIRLSMLSLDAYGREENDTKEESDAALLYGIGGAGPANTGALDTSKEPKERVSKKKIKTKKRTKVKKRWKSKKRIDIKLATKVNYQSYQGTRGGKGWKPSTSPPDSSEGVLYQRDKPGERVSAAPAPKPPAAPVPAAPEERKPAPQQTAQTVINTQIAQQQQQQQAVPKAGVAPPKRRAPSSITSRRATAYSPIEPYPEEEEVPVLYPDEDIPIVSPDAAPVVGQPGPTDFEEGTEFTEEYVHQLFKEWLKAANDPSASIEKVTALHDRYKNAEFMLKRSREGADEEPVEVTPAPLSHTPESVWAVLDNDEVGNNMVQNILSMNKHPDYIKHQKETGKFRTEYGQMMNKQKYSTKLSAQEKRKINKEVDDWLVKNWQNILDMQEGDKKLSMRLVKESLKVQDPTDIEFTSHEQPLSKNVQTIIDSATEFLSGIVSSSLTRGVASIPVKEISSGQRSNFTIAEGNINLERTAEAKTVTHEFGHYLEAVSPGLLDASIAFLERRAGDEQYVKINDIISGVGYQDHEVGKKDQFDKLFPNSPHRAYYVGKYYPDATEVMSIGMEMLVEDPVWFAKADPEYFRFVVAGLRGEFSKNDPQETVSSQQDEFKSTPESPPAPNEGW